MFSDLPGVRERHLRRKYQNPLFADSEVTELDIIQARKQDADELEQFMSGFRDLVQQAVALDASAEADVVLKLKEQLDKSYEQCSGLAGDQGEIKVMIRRLLKSIMQAMWKGIGQDFQAQSKLENEEKAREAHFAMLEYSLVGDLIRPDTPIAEDELVSVLLSESAENLSMAMRLFAPEQQMVLVQMARDLLASKELAGDALTNAKQRLLEMESLMSVATEATN